MFCFPIFGSFSHGRERQGQIGDPEELDDRLAMHNKGARAELDRGVQRHPDITHARRKHTHSSNVLSPIGPQTKLHKVVTLATPFLKPSCHCVPKHLQPSGIILAHHPNLSKTFLSLFLLTLIQSLPNTQLEVLFLIVDDSNSHQRVDEV